MTIDDWYNALTAFKEQLGKPGSLMLPPSGFYYSSEFVSAFGVGMISIRKTDSQVRTLGARLQRVFEDYIKVV